jgi:CBS-domain-containing membrane protein
MSMPGQGSPGARRGAYAALVSLVALGVAGVVGLALRQPWLFPSLGPTLMVIAETPRQPAARPRNVLVGHLVGVAAGYLALVVTRTTQAPPVIQTGVTVTAVVAAGLSVALTSLALQALRTPHPPAGATTLIVSLGLLSAPAELGTIVLAVLLVTVVATALNRLAGVGVRSR